MNIIFDEKETPRAPLKIKGIMVSTQRALVCETPQGDANIVLCEITKQGHHWNMQHPTPGGGGLDPSTPQQCTILDPKIAYGKTDFEGQPDWVMYGNEGADIQIDVPFLLETETLTSLLHYDKKLIIMPELKGEATIQIFLNGILQVLDGGKKQVKLSADPMKLALEIHYRHLSYWNVMTFKTVGGDSEHIGLRGFGIELSSEGL